MPSPDQAQIDTKPLGCLQAVNLRSQVKSCTRHGDTVEIIFDTGIVMYAPQPMFELMIFHLNEADPR